MHTKKNLLTTILVLFTMGFLFLSNNQKATAAQVEYETNWAIHVDFIGNQVNADLTVEVWEFTGGVQTSYLQWTRSLPCFVPNSVEISGNEAIFSGGDGIHCNVPSRRLLIYNLTNGEFLPPIKCESKVGAFAETEIVLDPNYTGQVRINSIFTMPDLALEAEMPPFPTLATLMHFYVDGRHAVSGQFTANPGLNSLLADFNQVNGPNAEDLAYQPFFVANGSLLPSFPSNIDADLALSLKKSSLDIGYSPETGEGLYGRITSLDIDPGCFGTG